MSVIPHKIYKNITMLLDKIYIYKKKKKNRKVKN
jgi:hypothetical protein